MTTQPATTRGRAAPPAGQGRAGGRRDSYTSDSLLAVAVEVFNRRGYEGASMEDLARAAGITKSSIYHHVRGKEELLRLAVGRALDALFAILDEPAANSGPAIDRVEHVVRRGVEVLLAELPYVTLLLRVRGNTVAERWALQRRREFDRRVAELVDQAARDGSLRSDIEPRLTARLLFGLVNSLTEWYRPGRGTGSAQVADAVVRLAFGGLRAPGR